MSIGVPRSARVIALVAVVVAFAGCQPTVGVRGPASAPGAGLGQAPAPTPLVPVNPRPSARRGRVIFERQCAVCHGEEGFGNGPAAAGLIAPQKNPMTDFFRMIGMRVRGERLPSRPANFHNQVAMRLNAPFVLVETVKLGRPHTAMPAFGPKPAYGANKGSPTLRDPQIWDAVSYVWTFSTTPAAIASAREIYESRPIDIGGRSATCAACHGTAGDGRGGALSAEMAAKVWGWSRQRGQGIFTDANLLAQRKPSELYQRIADGRGFMPSYRGKLKDDEIWALVDYVRTFMWEYAPARGQ